MNRLGATPTADGTRFEVWAPDATSVDIVVAGDRTSLDRVSAENGTDDGTWAGVVDGVRVGDRYSISLDGDAPLPDPASRHQPDGVHGPSAVVDVSSFDWTDRGWTGVSLADTVIYELHVGTFTSEGTFDSAVGQLARLADLGVTMLEVMPVNAFPGVRNWGYDGVFPFAVQQSYGGPAAMARFVDAAHAHGLGVMLDVVYNHLGPEGNVLGRFGPYFTDAYGTPWGPAVNVAGPGSDGVRRFFVENAVGWIEDFHLDGLRLDAVHAIVDPSATPMVEQLVAAVHEVGEQQDRHVLVTLESAANDPRMIRDTAEHGWGADAVWNDDVHHALRVALTGERHEYYAGYDGVGDLAVALRERWVYSGRYSPTLRRRHGAPATDLPADRFIVFDSNHDHVGNTPQGHRMFHGTPITDPRRRLAAAFILLSPFTPLIFMGSEYAETAPFPYFVDHGSEELLDMVRAGRRAEFAGVDWGGEVADPADPETFRAAVLDPTLASSAEHARVLAMYRELISLRRRHHVLMSDDAVQTVELDGAVITVVRLLGTQTATLVFNVGPAAAGPATVPVGAVAFDSDSAEWGGGGSSEPAEIPAWTARMWVG